ncbi:MAG TPA: transglutaminase family protein [Planctomycetota bacterium]|nr:transglutaminase family protein [Planctomycetota bacterium]
MTHFALRRASAGILIALILAASPAPARGNELFEEEWHLFFLDGKPAGYQRISIRSREDGGATVTAFQKVIVKRGPSTARVSVTTTTEEDATGRILGFRTVQSLSDVPMEAVGRREGEDLVVTESAEGKDTRTSRVAVPPEAVGPARADRILKERLKQPGDSAEVTTFLAEARRFTREKHLLDGEESVDIRGTVKTLRRVTSSVDILPGLVTRSWFDAELNLEKSSMPFAGLEAVTYRSSLEEVLRQDFSSPPEIFFSSAVAVNRRVPSGAREALYRITRREGARGANGSGAGKLALHEGPGQKIVKADERSTLLRVRRVEPREEVKRPVAATPELEEYLRPNAYIQSGDEAIRRIAEEVAGEESRAWKAACLLEKWVESNVVEKNLNTSFATAREVLASRSGDCTEHAVLHAALLRAAGIPARVVAGLVHVDGVFVGHMWTEVHAGDWIPLDPTRAHCGVGADHIALSVSSLDSSLLDPVLEIVAILGNIKIEVVELTE